MDEPQPVWAGRPERLTTTDLPRGCDMCGAQVTISEAGTPVGGSVLADDARDYVFCTQHTREVKEANPFARTISVMPPGDTQSG